MPHRAGPDRRLIRKAAKAIRQGQRLTSIAQAEACSKRSLRSRPILAFLAQPLERAILDGALSADWSTDRILSRNLSLDWAEQSRALGP